MQKSDQIFRFTFYLIIIVVTIAFAATFYIQQGTMTAMENFLSSASVAGFVAIFGQFATTLVQEYYKRKAYRICFICKKSQFSSAIASGVSKFFAKKTGIIFEVIQLAADSEPEKKMMEFLSKEANQFDGIIIRPINTSEILAGKINVLLNRGKKVVLVDVHLEKYQVESMFTNDIPFYVGSNFNSGGEIAATFINALVNNYGLDKTDVVLLLGPSNIAPSRKRGKSLLWSLTVHNELIPIVVELSSFKEESYLQKVTGVLGGLNNKENLLLFCGNDTVAKKMMQVHAFSEGSELKSSFATYKNIVFIGYDGIRDSDGKCVLNDYQMNYATIDVNPVQQGEVAAKVVCDKVTGSMNYFKTAELVEPTLRTNLESYERTT